MTTAGGVPTEGRDEELRRGGAVANRVAEPQQTGFEKPVGD